MLEGVGVNHMASFHKKAPNEVVPDVPIHSKVDKSIDALPVQDALPQASENQIIPPSEDNSQPDTSSAEVDAAPIVPPEESNTTTPPVQEPKPLELNDELALEYLKRTRSKEFNSIDDLFKEPEAPIDPFEGLDDSALQFIKYNKETGRSMKDFQALNKDFSKLSPLQLARERAIEMANGTLTQSNVDKYLEKKLGVDLEDLSNIDQFDIVDLEAFASTYRLKKIEEQAKYNEPIERGKTDNAEPKEELLLLDNGARITKTQYEEIVNNRKLYEESVKSATDNITNSAYQVKIDDNGNEKIIDVAYEYSKEDLHKMGSLAMDIDKAVLNLFSTENGEINHSKLQEGLAWADESFRGKAINSLIHKALAQQAKDFMKMSGNTNFNTKPIDNKKTNGKPLVIPGTSKNYGIKHNF